MAAADPEMRAIRQRRSASRLDRQNVVLRRCRDPLLATPAIPCCHALVRRPAIGWQAGDTLRPCDRGDDDGPRGSDHLDGKALNADFRLQTFHPAISRKRLPVRGNLFDVSEVRPQNFSQFFLGASTSITTVRWERRAARRQIDDS